MKLSIALAVAALTYMVGYVAYHGRKAHVTRDLTIIAHHRGATNCVMWIALIAIVLIELLVRQLPPGRPGILWVHLPLAATFAGLFLLMRFRFDGMRSAAHRYLAYACIAAYAGALVTGTIMLWRV
jgi:hypothetical protein